MSHSAPSRHPAGISPPTVDYPEPAGRKPKSELSVPEQPAVETWVQHYSQERYKSFQTQLDRARYYVAPSKEIFRKAGLPEDLAYVALVESGFSPKARSHANAVGMWQFISSTGKRFGLDQNQWIDERRHPFKAAQAAADYLSSLYDLFGSWELALAAYNAGENAVRGALDRSGHNSFWDLAANGYLPSETRDYVPKVMAVVKITRNPRQYGFNFDSGWYTPRHETVSAPGGMKLSQLGKKIGISESMLLDHNPELTRPMTPPDCSSYELCVPVGKREAASIALTQLTVRNETKVEKPKVSSPSSVLAAASQKNGNGKNASKPLGKLQRVAQKSCKPVQYPVRRGDTLWSISERFGVPIEKLRAHNELPGNQKLIPGDILKICSKERGNGQAARRRVN